MRVSDIKNFRLKPCPFCGGKYTPTLYSNEDDDLGIDEYISRVECDYCGATIEGDMETSLLEADIQAANLWNVRAAVNVVHCKDCVYVHANKNNGQLTCNRRMLGVVRSIDYCSYGKLKEE